MNESDLKDSRGSTPDAFHTAAETRERFPRGRSRQAWIALAAMLGAFTVFYSILSQLRFEEFYAGNWDLGINMQLLWTNTHGYVLFEAGDYEFARANSFLYVHPTYIAIPISYAYASVPTATMLFVVQAAAVTLSGVPIFLAARRREVPDWVIFCGLAVYLLSFSILSSLLFDFHWESFVPAELLWTYYLWERGRYWSALVPAVAGVLTLEVFPVLVVGLILYFAYPQLVTVLRGTGSVSQRLRTGLSRSRPLIGLLIFAASAFVALHLIGTDLLPFITGSAPQFPPHASGYFFFGVFWWGLSGSNLWPRLFYWLLLVAGFGFLPLLFRQRLLILTLPWFLYSVVMTPYPSYTQLGFQYAFLAVGPLGLGAVEALGELHQRLPRSLGRAVPWAWLSLPLPFLVASWIDSKHLIYADAIGLEIGLAILLLSAAAYLGTRYLYRHALRSRAIQSPSRRRLMSDQRSAAVVIAGFAFILVTANFAASPLNLQNFTGPGAAGYSFTYTQSPVYDHMPEILSKIPSTANVVSSDNLFPFVANNPDAYSLLWYPASPPHFPFNATHLPDDVLLSTSEWFLPGFLAQSIHNSTLYGLRMVLYSSSFYPGSIFLYKKGYAGAAQVVEVSSFPKHQLLCPNLLALGPSGVRMQAADTLCGSVIQSSPAANLSGNGPTIWYGPYLTLLPGNYSVTFLLRGSTTDGEPPGSSILVMDGSASGGSYWYYLPVSSNDVSPTDWTNFTLDFSLSEPAPNSEFRGYLGGVDVDGTFVPGNISLAGIVLNRI